MMTRFALCLLPILCLLLLSAAAAVGAPLPRPVQEAIRLRVENLRQQPVIAGETLHAVAALPDFYLQRFYQPAWMHGGVPAPAAAELTAALAAVQDEGLDPAHYHRHAIEDLQQRLSRQSPEARGPLAADLDLLLTDAFLLLASHYLHGRINPETIDPEWHARRRGGDPGGELAAALTTGQVRHALEKMLPRQPEYAGLRQQLQRYRALAAAGGWAPVPGGGALREGDRGGRVAALRSRLFLTGDLTAEPTGDLFDAELTTALRRFQRRHGLHADGTLGKDTLAALNVPVDERVHQIEVNLERWRWLPAALGERYLLVNIADFHLYAVEKGETVLDMRVVVGRPYRRTPVFSDRIRYLVLNPYWQVPEKIAIEDVLPQVRKDPAYLGRMQMKVLQGWGSDAREVDPAFIDWQALGPKRFPYRLRQAPGPANALGRIKFMFPNDHDVYLHDTPARELFAKDSRSFSSGCIRLERPLELAEYLLRGSRIDNRAALLELLQSGQDKTVPLPQAVPVHLLYWTAWVDTEGLLHFRPDIYGRDRTLSQALVQPPPAGDRNGIAAAASVTPAGT